MLLDSTIRIDDLLSEVWVKAGCQFSKIGRSSLYTLSIQLKRVFCLYNSECFCKFKTPTSIFTVWIKLNSSETLPIVNLPRKIFGTNCFSLWECSAGSSLFKVNEAQDPNEMSETDKRRNSNLKIDRSNGKNSTFFGYFYKVMALSTKRGEIIQCNPDFYLQYDGIQFGTHTFHV